VTDEEAAQVLPRARAAIAEAHAAAIAAMPPWPLGLDEDSPMVLSGDGGYRSPAASKPVVTWTCGKCPWRPGWWRRLMWRHTRCSAIQTQRVRQILGGVWVRVAPYKGFTWYPCRPPFQMEVSPDVPARWGTPLEFEVWEP
jgi:hypothetical protein